MSEANAYSAKIHMQLRDLEQTVTRLQDLSDEMVSTRIPHWRMPDDVAAAKQRRADGVELRGLLMPFSELNLAVLRAELDGWGKSHE